MLTAIFNDRHEPFWRSTKQIELGRIAEDELGTFVRARFAETRSRRSTTTRSRGCSSSTDGHPYATQELAYFTWEEVPLGHAAHAADVEAALTNVLRSEHNNLARVWEDATPNERLVLLALHAEPGGASTRRRTRRRHGLPARAVVQRAVTALTRDDIVERAADGSWAIAEPFLDEWLAREQVVGRRPGGGA